MTSYDRKDKFYKMAKAEGYVARSAYKMIELDQKYKIFKPGHTVVDLGCAPGGWLQVGLERLGARGQLIGVDLDELKITLLAPHAFVKGDFTDPTIVQAVRDLCPAHGVDWVISDLAPHTSGIPFRDQYQSYELCLAAFQFAKQVLKPNGGFLFKIFFGKEAEELIKDVKRSFALTQTIVPDATRKTSTERYFIATGFKPAKASQATS